MVAAAQAACREREPAVEDRWHGARAERTPNMLLMSVTLDVRVTQGSGWLNAVVPCRVERGGMGRGAACGAGEAGGRGAAAQSACREGASC